MKVKEKYTPDWSEYNFLKLDMRALYESGFKDHPLEYIKNMGIGAHYAFACCMSDTWQLWNPYDIPCELPDCLELSYRNPIEYIGFGLEERTANELYSLQVNQNKE